MKQILFLLLVLLSSPSSFADLYKCDTAAGTIYQDKPCQTADSQVLIEQTPALPGFQPAAANPQNLTITRDAHGKIKRSEKAKDDFKAANPCPANNRRSGSCPGYVIDHINPLACGGADNPENMQWQTVAAGKEKDSWERDKCSPASKQSSPHQSTPDESAATYQSTQANNTNRQTVYTGRRGGHYVLTKTGKKRYLPRQ